VNLLGKCDMRQASTNQEERVKKGYEIVFTACNWTQRQLMVAKGKK
jgi:hypothetical protein